MNKLWNRLVEIDRTDRAKYREIISEDAGVAEKELRLTEIAEEISKLSTERKQLRAAKRSKKVDDAPLVARINALRGDEKQIKAALKELRQASKEASKPVLTALNAERNELVKEARNASGLWWGNYNAVVESYENARSKAMKIGVDLRFHRFDGSGRFVNQIQGGVSVNDFMTGNHTVAWVSPELSPIPGRALKPMRRLHITVYTGRDEEGKMYRRTLSFPIVMERDIPETAEGLPLRIKTLSVSRKRIMAGRYEWSVTITATNEAEVPNHEGTKAVGVNLGWKKEGQSLRVATIYDSDGNSEHFKLPAQWMHDMDYSESLRGDIDEVSNEMFSALKRDITDSELLNKAKKAYSGLMFKFAHQQEIVSCKTAGKLDKRDILKAICTLPALESLPLYLSWAKRKEAEFVGVKNRFLRRRKWLYGNIAAQIAKNYAVVVLDNANYAQMAMLESRSGEENELSKIARANRFRASPSELRLHIEQAAKKHGCKIERVAQKNECAVCGKPSKQDGIIWECGNCGAVYDQDVNLAKLLIKPYLHEEKREPLAS